jgi:shikimate dehydrogenase
MNITAKTKICMVIGDPVNHSLSPQMHNSAYAALGIDNQFIFLAAQVNSKDTGRALEAVKTLGIRGLSCTIPHKTEVMKYLDPENIDDVAKKIGAVNTIVNENGNLKGYNTDWLGILTPLEKITTLDGKKIAILGAGGAARAVFYAVKTKGAKVTIYNRTFEKAQTLADHFGGEARTMEEIAEIQNADIIINATTSGMQPTVNETLVPKKFITNKHIVFDVVYNPFETKLLLDAKEKGATIIHGLEMLLYQGTAQFELFTGQNAPEEIMRNALLNKNE